MLICCRTTDQISVQSSRIFGPRAEVLLRAVAMPLGSKAILKMRNDSAYRGPRYDLCGSRVEAVSADQTAKRKTAARSASSRSTAGLTGVATQLLVSRRSHSRSRRLAQDAVDARACGMSGRARLFSGVRSASARGDRDVGCNHAPKIDQPMRLVSALKRHPPEMRVAIVVKPGRPDRDRRLARCDRENAAADAALARQANTIGELPRAVIVAACQHDRVDASRALRLDDQMAGGRDCARDGRGNGRPWPIAGMTSRSRNGGNRRRA